jgi:pyruvate formate lyase activating enzyme
MKKTEVLQSTSIEATTPFELRRNMNPASDSYVRQALVSGDVGFIHSFTTGSTVDGPGVRVVGWTAGCHWRCVYCHNPDTWDLKNGTPVPLDTAISEVKKYQHGLKVMSGGLTLSGGEPLMQDRFAVRLFSAAHGMGIHTALDTNGSLGERLSNEELEQIDLVLLDIKTWDPEHHLKLTGKDVGPTLEFARRLAGQKRPVWLRFVVVPGLTEDIQDIAHIAKFAAALGNIARVQVLPFHQMGKYKWRELGLDYTLQDVQPPSRYLIDRTCAIFRAEGLVAY